VCVVVLLGFDDSGSILNADEAVHVEALVTEVAAEALDLGVLDRLAAADEWSFTPAPKAPA
jgi:hypothetical protein